MSDDRQRFEEFLAKFRDCYQSIELRVISGRKGDEWRNIWTHVEFRPESPQEFKPEPDLPDTDYIRTMHTSLSVENAAKTIDAIEIGRLETEGTQVLYLSDSPDEKPGLRLSGSYRQRRDTGVPWSYAFLRGNGPYPLNGYIDKEGYDLNLHLLGLRHSRGDLDQLARSFGRCNMQRFESVGVLVRAPVVLRFRHDECRCEGDRLLVFVEGMPPFTSLPAHVNVVRRAVEGSPRPETRDLERRATT